MVNPVTHKVEQRQFASLDEFIEGQNNFYYHFLDGAAEMTEMKLERPVYQRFQAQYPEFCGELRRKATLNWQNYRSQKVKVGSVYDYLPMEDLFKAYQLMSELVDRNDPYVMDVQPPDFYLSV